MRQVHKAGEKAFVDYSGKKPHVVDPGTGEIVEVELFVAVLGASNYTFAEATATQRTEDFIGPASAIRAGTNPCCSGPTPSGRSTTRRSSFRHDRGKRVTRPKSKWGCRSPSGGSSPACVMRRSSRCTT